MMLNLPGRIKIKIVETSSRNPIEMADIIISVHLFAVKKNDYYLGPFFSNQHGEVIIDRDMLLIVAEAELKSGLMDYHDVRECSSLVEINVLSEEAIERMVEGRTIWGVIGREYELYNTKENLINRIKNSNNRFVAPRSLRVIWGEETPSEVAYEIQTNKH